MSIELHALHGFLGLPSDWDFLQNHPFRCFAHELFEIGQGSLKEWGSFFNQRVPRKNRNKRVLLGYSLGGRLAMHALEGLEQEWDAAVIISSHPGLRSQEERSSRISQDLKWAKRFAQDPWDIVIEDWNGQEVFKKSAPLSLRKEAAFSRPRLIHALTEWSLAKQEDLRPVLKALSIPILWLVGGHDHISKSHISSLSLSHPQSIIHIVPEAGHRVPWDCSEAFSTILSKFCKNI